MNPQCRLISRINPLWFTAGSFCVLALMWLPTPFIGFFSHHDGLMVTTVMQVRDALQGGDPWPFNQYGPSWAIFFATALNVVPSNFQLVAMRLIVLAGYALTAFFTFKSARLFGGPNFAFMALIFLAANQPFVFDLLPWPSAFVMPIVSIFVYSFISSFHSDKCDSVIANRKLFLSGSLIPIILLSRIQVGFLLLVVGIWAVIAYLKRPQILSFLSGFVTSSSIALGFLAHQGWLNDAMRDQVVFGSSYLHSENNPFPKFTLAAVFLIVLFFYISANSPTKIANLNHKRALLKIFILGIILAIIFVIMNRVHFSNLQPIITRKIWVSLPIACIAWFAWNALIPRKKKNSIKESDAQEKLKKILLFLSIASSSQIFPLFDQMHSWWGSAPSVILISLVLRDLTKNFPSSVVKVVQHFTILVLIFLAALTLITQLQNNLPLKKLEQFSLTYTSKAQASEMAKLQTFFSMSLPRGSNSLNLCENTDLFFDNQLTNSTSRIFLYWPAMEKSRYLMNEITKSKPSHIVVCRNLEISTKEFSKTGAPQVLKLLDEKLTQISNLKSNSGYEWTIYAYGNQT